MSSRIPTPHKVSRGGGAASSQSSGLPTRSSASGASSAAERMKGRELPTPGQGKITILGLGESWGMANDGEWRTGQYLGEGVKASAVVDTTFVDIYVDTKNIPTCRYDIQHVDKRTMEK